ncbi:hypothetical protein V565_275240 [Rhizoctonia solani 123E]|uniref:Uncharacterized protein n=1 Tax=Rhizoctonia solani 123E TaxID=1423351 RepID=A0A074S5S2_9AGAM|nr:hypothetical protein V565_275240 [Rhizoctonia solani 123E]
MATLASLNKSTTTAPAKLSFNSTVA